MSMTPPEETPQKTIENLRILEIGDRDFFYELFPRQVTWIWTSKGRLKDSGADPKLKFTWKLFFDLRRRIARNEFDLIVLTLVGIPLYRVEHFFLKKLFYFLRRFFFKFFTLAPYLVFFVDLKKTKLVVLDSWDDPIIRPQYFIFFSRLSRYFKRELPPNHWQAFLCTTRRYENLGNIRKEPAFVRIQSRLRTLPIRAYRRDQLAFCEPVEKNTDIFYVGMDHNPIRQKGVQLLRKFQEQGWRVDMPTTRLSKEEFSQRLQRSWLAFSPQGDGWQCHRTYEAIIHGAVPVMNYPVVERYRPLRDGVHAFYYGCEEEHLLEVLRQALGDKARLVKMLASAREYLSTFYSAEAVLQYVWSEVNEPDDARL
jgi:hypothetical protein